MKAIEKFTKYYLEEKESLEKTINEYNESLIDENELFKENLNYFKSLNSDGKLIRGILVNLGYNLLNNKKNYSNNLALAYELFQTSILIHDDIIDKDDKRRGKDTIHHANYKKYHEYSNKRGEVAHLGNSLAICMGDYGLYQANKVIVESYKEDKNLPQVLSCFYDVVLKTIKGETLDVILPFESKYTGIDENTLENTITDIYKLKTAYYTIIGPLSTGLLLAGADQEKLKDIEKFGEKVGVAFQIQDDILGIYSDQTGKIKGSDIREFKQTILYSYTYSSEYKEELEKYYGQEEITAETIDKVKEIFDISGAKNYANHLMNKMFDDGLKILDNISWLEEEQKDILRGFVDYLRIRNK